MLDGEVASPGGLQVVVRVSGLVALYKGTATSHALLDAATGRLGRARVSAKFDPPTATSVPLLHFRTEAEFHAHMRSLPQQLKISALRVAVPRLWISELGAFWPPSLATVKHLAEMGGAISRGFRSEPSESDLSAAWQPIWDKYPAEQILASAQQAI